MTSAKSHTSTATINIRSSCSGTVHIATLKVGKKVVYETRAWGTSHNAALDAESRAAELGLSVRQAQMRRKG